MDVLEEVLLEEEDEVVDPDIEVEEADEDEVTIDDDVEVRAEDVVDIMVDVVEVEVVFERVSA